MCIRALDYLPPVDVRFGEFLRAIITADTDLIPDDRMNYRLAFVEAFRRRGILPENCLSMSPDNLMWDLAPQGGTGPDYLPIDDLRYDGLNLTAEYQRSNIVRITEENRRRVWYWLSQPEMYVLDRQGERASEAEQQRFAALRARARATLAPERPCTPQKLDELVDDLETDLRWLGVTAGGLSQLRSAMKAARTHIERWDEFLHCLHAASRVRDDPSVDRRWEEALGIYFQRPLGRPLYTIAGSAFGLSVEVASVRTTRRSGPDGQDIRQLVIEVTQRRQGYFDATAQEQADGTRRRGRPARGDFTFRGGATLIIDLRDFRLRYVISKSIADDQRLARQREHLLAPSSAAFTYNRGRSVEPFAMLHRG
jgi:hypothetical protein